MNQDYDNSASDHTVACNVIFVQFIAVFFAFIVAALYYFKGNTPINGLVWYGLGIPVFSIVLAVIALLIIRGNWAEINGVSIYGKFQQLLVNGFRIVSFLNRLSIVFFYVNLLGLILLTRWTGGISVSSFEQFFVPVLVVSQLLGNERSNKRAMTSCCATFIAYLLTAFIPESFLMLSEPTFDVNLYIKPAALLLSVLGIYIGYVARIQGDKETLSDDGPSG